MIATPERILIRVFENLRIEGDCWLSQRSTVRGYPQIGWSENGKNHMRLAHRVAWEAVNGPIPGDLTVDHMRTICIGPPCIRPEHLRLLPNFENSRRTGGRDWPLGECAHGHPNSELVQYRTQRMCGTCKKIRDREYTELRRMRRVLALEA